MIIRPLTEADFPAAQALYLSLTRADTVGDVTQFGAVLAHPGTRVIGRFDDRRLLSMATLHILPNMTYGGTPYALIENVVTDPEARGEGHGRAVLEHILAEARAAKCYKAMLLTGRARGAHGFYEAVGFSAEDKWGMTVRF